MLWRTDPWLWSLCKACLWLSARTRALFSKDGDEAEKWAVVETAGGVASPGPSGTLQCDLYRCNSGHRNFQ